MSGYSWPLYACGAALLAGVNTNSNEVIVRTWATAMAVGLLLFAAHFLGIGGDVTGITGGALVFIGLLLSYVATARRRLRIVR